MNEQSSSVTIEDKQETLIGKVCNPWTWRLANGFMALFFAFATYVQLNDPDPVIWMLIYAIPCFLCIALVIDSSLQDHYVWRYTAVIHVGVSILGIFYSLSVLFTTEITSKNPLEYEEGREIGGLLIITAWLGLCWLRKLGSFSEANVFFWSATVAVSLTPFVLLGYYVNTWDVSAIQGHCKDIISRHLYKEI